jgi:hypothetical protein
MTIRSLKEGLEYKDMVDMIKPTVFIDEFTSKVGEDDAYIVLSFYVHNSTVAEDLVRWFETGYDFVVDADRSPGEIEPNRYLVFVEIKRRTYVIPQLEEMLEDLETLTDFTIADWTVTYEDMDYPFDSEVLSNLLLLSPQSYREAKGIELNEMRTAANLPTKRIYSEKSFSKDLDAIRQQAGLL